MTREEAIKTIMSANVWTDEEREALGILIPELAESEDERIRKVLIHIVKSACSKYGIKYIGDKITEEMLLAYLEKQKEQKDYHGLYDGVSQSDWFKENYEGKSLGEEENPKEWSEEDEKKINFLSRLIEFQVKDDEYCFGDGRLISKQEAIEMLKSLRPVSKDSLQSWKPSEAHLSALLAIFNDPDNIGSQTCQLALTDLYEQLNKL